MSDLGERLNRVAGDMLEPGEVISRGTRCAPMGAMKRRALSGGLGGAMGLLVNAASGAPPDHALYGESLPHDLALGLTDRRLFVFAVSVMTGRATRVVQTIPLGNVVNVDSEEARSLGRKVVRFKLRLVDRSKRPRPGAPGSSAPLWARSRPVSRAVRRSAIVA
jgi:hypothetical protein